MKEPVRKIFEQLLHQLPELGGISSSIEQAYDILYQCYRQSGKVLICGNGGSAADSEHIVGELMKGFLQKRPIPEKHREALHTAFPSEGEYLSSHLQGALPAISLVSQTALAYAFINDVAPDMVFAQQVFGYGQKGDVLIGLSTSGNSVNVVNAVKVARVLGIKTLGFTGEGGGAMEPLCDAVIKAPANETYRVQEYHLPLYHALCAMLEVEFF